MNTVKPRPLVALINEKDITMTKHLLQITFVLSTIIIAFFLGTHFVDNKKDTEKYVKQLVAEAIYTKQRDNTPVVIMYHKDQEKEKQTEKIDTPAKRLIGYSSTVVKNNIYLPISDLDYLIKWDEEKGWFNTEHAPFQYTPVICQFGLAGY